MNEKILIVDDEPDVLQTLEALLTPEGFQVRKASGGKEVLDICRSKPPDLVITDIRMPGMDGLEVIKHLKQLDQDIEIIVLTGFASINNAIEALQDGRAFDFLRKPLENIDELFNTIRQALEKRRLRIQNRKLFEELGKHRDHLEGLVEQRTAELQAANEQLQREITERKQAEEALRESQQWLAATLKSIGDAVITTDNEGSITFMNSAAEALTGWKYNEISGKDIGFAIIDKEIPSFPENSASKAPRNNIVINITNDPLLITRDGTEIPVEYSGGPIKDDEGDISGVVMVIKDVTKRKQAGEKLKQANEELLAINTELHNTQSQLIQSAKLASIGELATGVAHELNQPLMYIRNSAQLAMMNLPDNPDPQKVHKVLKRVEKGTDRMMKIIDQLRSFARQTTKGGFTPLNVHDILENSLILIHEQFKLRNIQLEEIFALDLPSILGNHQQLEQVFINLLNNARDALEGRENPKLTIQTAFRQKTDNVSEVAISFIDNGSGISQDDLEKIFDPFFTTKEEGKGTGLGLSISYGIIQNHRGQIHVSSVEGEGTAFTITLPVMEGQHQP